MRRGTRGRGYGGGGNRPPQRAQMNIPKQLQPSQHQAQSGPAMVNHLKDIDIELELLKRKREIIEQQQQILSNSYNRRNDYEQSFSQSRDNRYDDYTRLYDNSQDDEYSRGGRGGSSQSRKRTHNVPVWENEAPPKRYLAPSRGAKAVAPRAGPPHNSRSNLHQVPEQRFPTPKPHRRLPHAKKNFNPTKVTKPSTAPPLKLASYQPAERKKLVTEAMASAKTVRLETQPLFDWLLRADCKPNPKMIGRLELGLGAIMKDLKETHPEHVNLFKSAIAMRAMKKLVRERVRVAMIGKQVTNANDIQAAYYALYPPTHDVHVVTAGIEAQENNKFHVIDTDNPEKYYKRNVEKLMALKMEEMIDKLKEIYGSGGLSPVNTDQLYAKVKFQPQKDKKPKTDSVTPTNSADSEAKTNEIEKQTKEDSQPIAESELIDLTLKPDESEVIIESDKTVGVVEEAVNAKTPVVQETAPDTSAVTKDAANEETPAVQEMAPDISNAVTKDTVKEDTPAVQETVPDASNAVTKDSPNDKMLNIVNNEHYMALDNFVTYKMLHLLKRYTPDFVKILNTDKMYRETKAAIANETRNKMENPPESEQEDMIRPLFSSKQNTANKKAWMPIQHYVKILGKPSLPKRKAMESFFRKFGPKTIKKHKSIHNLLFVGLTDQESYEQMLAADGTMIGRFTLDIKISEKKNDNKKNQNKIEEIQGSELDNQITNLLTSINQSENLFDEDIVMAEPSAVATDATENGDKASKIEPEIVVCEQEVADDTNDDDVVEFTDAIKGIINEVSDVEEIKGESQNNDVIDVDDQENKVPINVDVRGIEVNKNDERSDTVPDLKNEAKEEKTPNTPTRASARLVTAGGIRTRRMSKLPE